MAHWQTLVSLVVAWAFTGTTQAQTISLAEAPPVDSYQRVQLSMVLNGTLKLQQDGREILLKESASATHDFVERILEASAENTAGKSARVYKTAKVAIVVDKEKLERTLRPDRAFLVA